MVGQLQKATISYQIQANGTATKMVQTLTRSVTMCVSDVCTAGRDAYAERLTFAMNTAQSRLRK